MKRFLAYCVDLGIVSAVMYAILGIAMLAVGGVIGGFTAAQAAVAISNLGELTVMLLLLGLVLALLLTLAVYHGYFIYYEFKTGQTPGKRLFGIRVVSLTGEKLTMSQCVWRDAWRYIDCMLLFPGLISMETSERKQRIGDRICSTLVVYSRRREEQQKFLYVTQENFESLRGLLKPTPVPEEVRRQFLSVAYPIYILGRAPTHPEDLLPWETLARSYLPGAGEMPGGLDQTTALLFFAEHCFQAHNEENKS